MARTADPNLRPSILKAARELFAEKGYGATRMSDIATRAGVAVGTIYLYFKTKEAMCNGFADVINARILAESMPLLDSGAWPDAIANSLRTTMRIMAEERDIVSLLFLNIGFGAFQNYQPTQIEIEMVGRFARTVQARIASGECRLCEPEMTYALISSLVERVSAGSLLLGVGDYTQITEAIVAFVQNALVNPNQPVNKGGKS